MPFTLAHPLAVLPLARLGHGRALTLGLAPLVAGSMAPDVPYFLPLPLTLRSLTHSLQGALTVDVVVGVALLAVGVLVARPLSDLLPPGWTPVVSGWTPDAFPRSIRAVPLWYAALAAGAVTHVAWDAFTHPDGWVVQRWSVLHAQVTPWAVYHWLQYVSGLVGCSVLGWLVVRAVRRDSTRRAYVAPTARVRRLRLVLVTGMAVAATMGAVLRLATDHDDAGAAFDVVTGASAGACAAVLAYAVAARALSPRRRAGPARWRGVRPAPRSRG